MRFHFKDDKSGFKIEVINCNNLKKFLGLMFTRKEKANALLFNFKKTTRIKLHSFFVFFPFIAIWLDEKNKIVDLQIVKPFRFSVSSKNKFSKILEIPINKRYEKINKNLIRRF